jgi:hypothetical protein
MIAAAFCALLTSVVVVYRTGPLHRATRTIPILVPWFAWILEQRAAARRSQ